MDNESSDPPKDLSKRIYIINSIIYLFYSVMIYGLYFGLRSSAELGEVVAGLFTIYATAAHSSANLIIAIIRAVYKKKDALAFTISFLLILLLGNGVCFLLFSSG